jgi:geranylgeranyl reductase
MTRVVVVGASCGGGIAADTLRDLGVEVILLERDLRYIKPCGGAVPPLAFSEFDLPQSIIDRKVTIAVVASPQHITEFPVVSSTPNANNEYIAMVRREIFDGYIRNRAVQKGAELIEAKFNDVEVRPDGVRVKFTDRKQREHIVDADAIIGADGAYSQVAKSLGLPRLEMVVAYQERIHLPEAAMAHWQKRAAIYLADDVSPDLYAWVFPKCDHVAAGIGAGAGHSQHARQFLNNLKSALSHHLGEGKSIKFEAHHLPMRPRKFLSYDRATLIGDAAGLVQATSGEGIYWAMKSGAMAARAIVECAPNLSASNLRRAYDREWWKKYQITYSFLQFLQRISYNNDIQREIFARMCGDVDVQRLTFDGYLSKVITPAPWTTQMKITAHWLGVAARTLAKSATKKQIARPW